MEQKRQTASRESETDIKAWILRELEVIPAKSVEGLGESTSIRRVAAYVRVSTDNDEQTSSYELQKNYYTDYIKHSRDGNSLESMMMKASAVHHWSIAKECSS